MEMATSRPNFTPFHQNFTFSDASDRQKVSENVSSAFGLRPKTLKTHWGNVG
jgi:hypothetical protein